ncbi:MAG: hypothetical protein AAFQ82_13195, partial [Myxococcota bacterium]
RMDDARFRLCAAALSTEWGSASTAIRWGASAVLSGRPLFPLEACARYGVGRVGDFIAARKHAKQAP